MAGAGDRARIMADIQKILQDDAVIAQSFWRSVFVTANKRVQGVYAQVALEQHYNKVWLA